MAFLRDKFPSIFHRQRADKIELKAIKDNPLRARKFPEKLNYATSIVHSEPSRATIIVSSERNIFSARKREREEVGAHSGLITTRAAAGSRRPLKGRTVIPCNGRAGTIRYVSTMLRANSFVSSSMTLSLQRRGAAETAPHPRQEARHRAPYNNNIRRMP